MNTRIKTTTLAFIILWVPTMLHAQTSNTMKREHVQRFNISYVFGGQVYNDTFIYNPGMSFEGSYGVKVSEDVSIAIGTGYMGLLNENFIPVFIETIGYHHRKNRQRFIKFQGGYSFAWSNESYTRENYDINDGMFFDFGIGRIWEINENLNLAIQTSYRHQFASMNYTMYGNQEFNDVINFDMLVLTVGIINL